MGTTSSTVRQPTVRRAIVHPAAVSSAVVHPDILSSAFDPPTVDSKGIVRPSTIPRILVQPAILSSSMLHTAADSPTLDSLTTADSSTSFYSPTVASSAVILPAVDSSTVDSSTIDSSSVDSSIDSSTIASPTLHSSEAVSSTLGPPDVTCPTVPLITRLRNAYAIGSHKERFIPRQHLEQICNKAAVAEALAEAFPEKNANSCQALASAICYGQMQDPRFPSQPCCKIFAILVLLGKVMLIDLFLKHPLCDDDLPLYDTGDLEALVSRQRKPARPLRFPPGYDGYDIVERFIERQWVVLAPYFHPPKAAHMRCNVYDLHEKTILPIEYISKQPFSGGFGLVQKIAIHKEHNGFKHQSFALKTMHPMIPEERDRFFEQELDAFQKAQPGGHIIEICAAFKKGESRGFLFPWADGGTLNHIWNKRPCDIIASVEVQWSEFSRWICIQCHGITRDLWAIHEPFDLQIHPGENAEDLFGIHSDIKPDNILYFSHDGPPLGTLKVSDLGLMKFHRLISRTVQSKSMGHAYQTYRAPEHDMGRVRSRKIDIWAFGCLFAEFLTWVMCGKSGIEAFKTERLEEDKRFPDKIKGEWSEDNFFIMKTDDRTGAELPERKSSVDDWFTARIKDLGPGMEDTFFPDFLRFIQNSMLDPNREERADCKDVQTFLGKLLEKPADSPYWRFNGTVPYPDTISRSSTMTEGSMDSET